MKKSEYTLIRFLEFHVFGTKYFPHLKVTDGFCHFGIMKNVYFSEILLSFFCKKNLTPVILRGIEANVINLIIREGFLALYSEF